MLLLRQQKDDLNLTPSQRLILVYLLSQKEGVSCSADIQEQFGITKPSISRTLKALRRLGYLEMNHCQEDDRRKTIVLTELACAARKQIEDDFSRQHDCLCDGISEEDLNTMVDCLQTMITNLKRAYTKERAV